MKIISSLMLLLCLFSFEGNSQDNSDENSNGLFENNPFAGRSVTRCPKCCRYHRPHCNPPTPNTPVPIDGGLSILLAAGAAYGVKRMKNKKA